MLLPLTSFPFAFVSSGKEEFHRGNAQNFFFKPGGMDDDVDATGLDPEEAAALGLSLPSSNLYAARCCNRRCRVCVGGCVCVGWFVVKLCTADAFAVCRLTQPRFARLGSLRSAARSQIHVVVKVIIIVSDGWVAKAVKIIIGTTTSTSTHEERGRVKDEVAEDSGVHSIVVEVEIVVV